MVLIKSLRDGQKISSKGAAGKSWFPQSKSVCPRPGSYISAGETRRRKRKRSQRQTTRKPAFWLSGFPALIRVYFFLFCSLLLILSITLCQAAEIESVIPAYSVAYAVVKDVPGIWDAAKASSSWQALLLSDKLEMQDIKAVTKRAKELLGVDLRTLVEIFGHRVAFVQIHMDAQAIGPPVIIADVGDLEGASEMIRQIEQALGSGEEYEIQSHAGAYLTIPFGLAKRREEDLTVRYAFLDNLFVVAPGRDAFEAVVDVHLGENPSLLYDPKFNRMRAEVSADGEIFVYVNLEHPWSIVLGTWRPRWNQLLQILGVPEIKSIAWTTNLLSPTRDQEMYIYTGDSRSLLVSMFAEPKSLLSPHLIPASSADIFFAVHLGNPAAVWQKTKDAMRSTAGEEEYAQMQNEMSEFERGFGLSLTDDILSCLTGEFGFAMPFPELMKLIEGAEFLLEDGFMFWGVKDRERCATSIERLLVADNVSIHQTQYKGVTVYHISAMSGPEGSVGYMFAGDLLIFGNSQKLEDIIKEEPPLVVSEEFAQIRSQFPEQLGLLCCVNLAKLGERLLMATPEVQPEDDMARLQTLGSIGGTLIYDGEGLKARFIGAPGKSWLETIGDLAHLLIRVPF